ncbi:hypothetical protein AB1Y20_017987 [Prymnesium parvum]|uniref:3'-5' exonuclease n=1 Tax=Prymnesium parvum TaxID=97485 RepID=A0AB34JNK4_PRYPA
MALVVREATTIEAAARVLEAVRAAVAMEVAVRTAARVVAARVAVGLGAAAISVVRLGTVVVAESTAAAARVEAMAAAARVEAMAAATRVAEDWEGGGGEGGGEVEVAATVEAMAVVVVEAAATAATARVEAVTAVTAEVAMGVAVTARLPQLPGLPPRLQEDDVYAWCGPSASQKAWPSDLSHFGEAQGDSSFEEEGGVARDVQVACESDSSDSEVEDNEEVDEEGFQTWEGRLHAAVTERLAAETDRSRLTDCWLLRHLSANGWWLRAGAVNIDQHGQLKLSDGACDPHYRMFKDMSQEASTFYEVDTQVVLPDLMYPRGRELIKLVIEWHASARPYFDCEAKKRGGRQLHIDASYKTAKHIGLYHGNRLFKGVISGLNEDGDIRVLHMAVTDGHDQLETVFDELAHTQAQYGLDPIQVVSTDKPADERNFYERKFPAVRQLCDRINSSSDGRLTDAEGTGKDGLKQIDEGRIQFVRYVNNAAAINNSCDNLRDIVAALPESFQVIGLDGEWDTPKDARGLPIGQDRMALVQLAFPIEAEENFRVGVVLCHVVGMKKLPARMWALLADSNFKFIGRQVGGDISKICRDFGAGRLKQYVQTEDLGTMARKRDIVQHGTATLDKIVANLFGVKLLKDPAIRLSKWSQQPLSDAQLRYAALDPYASLLAYFSLAALPDRTARLSRDEAILGATVDIVPASGLISQLGTRAAIAIIEGVDSTAPPVPHPCVPGKLVAAKKDQIVVRVVQVLAPGYLVHIFKNGRRSLSLSDFGHSDFRIIVNLNQLASPLHPSSP